MPVVVILLLIVVVPVLLSVRDVKGVPPPTAPVKVTFPDPGDKVRASPPFNVLSKVIFPFDVVVNVIAPVVNVTGAG